MAIDDSGTVAEAQRRMQERARRMNNLTPAFKVGAAYIQKVTDDSFDKSKSPAGVKWPNLAPSTALGRKGVRKRLKSINRRTKAGGLTKGAQKGRFKLHTKGVLGAEAFGGGGIGALGLVKPLVDTARARNSQRAKGSRTGIKWTAIGYLEPHISGGKPNATRPPKRNPSVFEGTEGHYKVIPKVKKKLDGFVTRYVETGRP